MHAHEVDMKIIVSTWRNDGHIHSYTQPAPPKRRYLALEEKRQIVEETCPSSEPLPRCRRQSTPCFG